MKKFLFILSISLFSSQLFSQDFKKLDNVDIDSIKCQIAQKFATDFYTKLKSGSFYQFQDEAIDQIKTQMSEDFQKATYKQIKEGFGDFVSLEYAETWIQATNPNMKIYRFKSKFDKSKNDLEIRVVIIDNGKVAGFWIKPWNNKLQ